jgi:hypothetical protein
MSRREIIKALLAAAESLDPEIPCIVGGSVLSADKTGFGGEDDEEDLETKDLLYGPEPFNLIPMGEKVEAHLNLGHKFKEHKLKTWSLRWKKKSGRVFGHVTAALLGDVKFRVGLRGAEKAAEGEKTVHAFADGKLLLASPPDQQVPAPPQDAVQVRYNPHEPEFMKSFMRKNPDTGLWDIPVAGCSRLWLTPEWRLFAVGLIDKAKAT